MRKITEVTRRDIFDVIQNGFSMEIDTLEYEPFYEKQIPSSEMVHVFMPFSGRYSTIDFLDRLYHLDSLPSTDRRYKTARGDITCHTVSFNDWPEFWFLDDERFELKDGFDDEPLLKFICEMLHPAVRDEESSWKRYLEHFNELLRPDGYEIYSAYKISEREIYRSREYINTESLLPSFLFTERYRELIHYGEGEPIDNISANVNFKTKKQLFTIMFAFAEPFNIRRNRYDSWVDHSDALSEAITQLNDYIEIPLFDASADMFSPCPKEDIYAGYFTPFVFDLIEYQYGILSRSEKQPFREKINQVFTKENLQFQLSDRGLIELVPQHEIITSDIVSAVDRVSELGIKELINEAIEKHMQPTVQSHRDAVEKIWDALERLKTYYSDLDKKNSAAKIINDMAGGSADYISLFNSEFKELTDIGNSYRIRHHEISKVNITDPRHYDYFFNRCLSLVALAIQYLQ